LVFHDPDDEISRNFFSEIEKVILRNINAQIVFPNVIIRNAKGKTVNYWQTGPFEIEALLSANTLPATSCIDRGLFLSLGGYRIEMEDGMEDWDLWVRAAIAGAVAIPAQKAEYSYTEFHPKSRTVNLQPYEEKQKLAILINAYSIVLRKLNDSNH
jgi:hypothetical protein